jgi:hypothetical protein
MKPTILMLAAALVCATSATAFAGTTLVQDGGKKVEVRGYIGVPMFGRSQVWLRQE